jgi:hypothetical protein
MNKDGWMVPVPNKYTRLPNIFIEREEISSNGEATGNCE